VLRATLRERQRSAAARCHRSAEFREKVLALGGYEVENDANDQGDSNRAAPTQFQSTGIGSWPSSQGLSAQGRNRSVLIPPYCSSAWLR